MSDVLKFMARSIFLDGKFSQIPTLALHLTTNQLRDYGDMCLATLTLSFDSHYYGFPPALRSNEVSGKHTHCARAIFGAIHFLRLNGVRLKASREIIAANQNF